MLYPNGRIRKCFAKSNAERKGDRRREREREGKSEERREGEEGVKEAG